MSRPSHAVQLVEGTRLAATVGALELDVDSFHRWSPDALGRGLRVAATSDGAIEGLEFEGARWALGVQWHLELLDDSVSARVFGALVAAAARAR